MHNTSFPFSDDPALLGGGDLLSDDERIVGQAYLRLIPLLDALQENPFHEAVYADLRHYLDGLAYEAVDAYARLYEKGPAYLTDRLAALDPAAGYEGEGFEWE